MVDNIKPTELITIKFSDLLDLLEDSDKLMCLESGGVDNWDWYSESLESGGFLEDAKGEPGELEKTRKERALTMEDNAMKLKAE